MFECAVAVPERYDLGLVVGPLSRGPHDPTVRLSRDELWRAANTSAGPATLHVRIDRRVAHARAWGDGAEIVLGGVESLLGLCDDPDALATDDARVHAWQRACPHLRLSAAGTAYDLAVRTVIEQRVTGVEARRTWFGLVRRFGAPAPGPNPDVRVPPPPAVLARVDDAARRALGLEARRGLAVRRLATDAARVERAARAGPAALHRALTDHPGIGAWTSASVRDLVLGDPDAVPVGDWHIAKQVVFAFTGHRGGDDIQMLELLEPFAGQRGRVVRLALAAGAVMARRAPRAEIADAVRREQRGQPYRYRRTLRFA